MGKLVERMRTLGSKRSKKKAAAARSNGLKGGRPVQLKIGAWVEIRRLLKLRHNPEAVSKAAESKIVLRLRDHNQHAGRMGIVLEIAPHKITWRYRRHLWREKRVAGRWRLCKTAETRDDERTILRKAARLKLDNGDEVWVPLYQVRLAALTKSGPAFGESAQNEHF